jgi:flagella basal body P-ring formation protein FlgA
MAFSLLFSATAQADDGVTIWPSPAPTEAPTQIAYQSADQDRDAAVPLEMKQNVVVDAPVIRLGDLFNQPVSGGDTPVAPAPKPGQTISLDYRFLSQLARAYRLDVSQTRKFDRILVARKAQLIKADAVIAAVADAIQQRTQHAANLDIAFDSGQLQFTLPTNVEATVGVQGLNFDPTTNRFVAVLVVPANGPTLISQQVIGTVYEKTEVPVLKRLVSAGETIQADDIDWVSSRVDQVYPSTLTDAQQMIGRVAKRPLRAGQMLRASDVVNQPAIQKNSLITIAVQTAQMSLTVRGKALEDGAIGQSIRVMNVNSRKQLVGVVKDAGTVVIPSLGPIAMN